jgi:hypothetical protein
MRLTVGFTEDAPQHELVGPAADLLTSRFLQEALDIGATRSLIMRADFISAIDAAGNAAVTDPELAVFIDRIRAEEDEQMVQLKWWPA